MAENDFLVSAYPDPRIEALDKRFTFQIGNAAVEKIAGEGRWVEGPVYFRDHGALLWSDIPNNRIMRWLEADGSVSVFRQPSNNSNGNTRDRQGRLVSCEHLTRRVTRTEYDGKITVLADRFQGKKFNAPNDVIVDSVGAVWFSDPGYGIESNYEGDAATAELPRNVYRISPTDGTVELATGELKRPNGLAFSPDEKTLYVVNSLSPQEGTSQILAFEVKDGRLGKSRVFAEDLTPGTADGIRLDTSGNVWCSMGWGAAEENGARCYAPNGDLIGKIHLPEPGANLCFGGPKNNRLFMAAGTSIYAVYLNTVGV